MKPRLTPEQEMEDEAIARLSESKRAYFTGERRLVFDYGRFWVVHHAEYEDLLVIDRVLARASGAPSAAAIELHKVPLGPDRISLASMLHEEIAASHLSELEFFDLFFKGVVEFWHEIRDALDQEEHGGGHRSN